MTIFRQPDTVAAMEVYSHQVSKNRSRQWTPLLLVIAGSLLLLSAAAFGIYSRLLELPGSISLPAQVAGQPLRASLTGQAALDDLTRLHGKSFALTAGAVGYYGQDHATTLWVSRAVWQPGAKQILIAMRDKIAEGRSPFQPRGEHALGNRTIYELDGLGQRHYYFQSGRLVIWLAAPADLSELALTEILAFYP